MLRDRANDSQGEIAKLQKVWSTKLKQTEDDMKQCIQLERRKVDELQEKLDTSLTTIERL